MAEQVLSRAQRNFIFEMTKAESLDPAEFDWSAGVEGRTFKEVFVHPPTKSFFEFSHFDSGGWWLHWWPDQAQGERYERSMEWDHVLRYVARWLTAVRADHQAPDLWAEIAKEKKISGAAGKTEQLDPFSAAELKQLESGLADIEHYIAATQPLDPKGQQELRKRFGYLLDAAKRGVRKVDWLNIFVGQMVEMVTSGLLDAGVYNQIMAHAATTLNAVFQLGLKLLG